jgi:hypothetical protein
MPKPHVKGIEEPDLRTTLDPKRTALAERCRSWDLADILFPDLDVAFCPITDSARLRLSQRGPGIQRHAPDNCVHPAKTRRPKVRARSPMPA